jgi:hypothetical protein
MNHQDRQSEQATVDLMLKGIQDWLVLLAATPSTAFARKHRKKVEHIRASLREVAAKLPPRSDKLGRPEDEMKAEKGRDAYELKKSDPDLTWRQVARVTGVLTYRGNRYQILDWARDHAIRNGLPWPLSQSYTWTPDAIDQTQDVPPLEG